MNGIINFGAYLHELRKERNATLEVLCNGLCDVGKLSRIENGQVEAEKLLRDRLLGRLGVEPENYENFLYHTEYVQWKERQEIVYHILYGEVDEAKKLLDKYRENYSMTYPLAHQFYLSMYAQIRNIEGAGEEELRELFQYAVGLTMAEVSEKKLDGRLLSVEELNLLLEYTLYNKRLASESWYEELLAFVEHLQLDKLALSKIYPKMAYYYYKMKMDTGIEDRAEISKMLRLCNKAIESLREAKRLFYLWELLVAKETLLQKLIVLNGETGTATTRLEEWCQECREWSEALEILYDRYGISKDMRDFCYLYVDMEAYCIGDVIRIRRKMLGMTMQELCDGICSERTVSRLERNLTEPQKEIVRLLFERLNMSMEFCRSDLITESPDAKKLFAEMKLSSNYRECDKAEQLLSQVRQMISLDIPENRQAIRRNEIVNDVNRKFMNKEQVDRRVWIEQIKEALSYTIPYEVAIASGEKYLTQNELSCIQNIVTKLTWDAPEMKECIKTLYELFEQQRNIRECLAAYEFVMGTVASKLGDRGEYDISDEIVEKILKSTLMNRRSGVVAKEMYGLLWNDVQREKNQHPVKRGVDVKKELELCIRFCMMHKYTYKIPFYHRKIEEGM